MGTARPPIYIDDAAIREHLPIATLIEATERALVALSAGDCQQPVRTHLPLRSPGSHMFTMPGVLGLAGLKLVTLVPDNEGRGLPTHMGIILAVNPRTGEPIAILDAGYITQMRTAAASVVATKYLAAADPRKLALIGAGVQGEGHLLAMRVLFPDIEAVVWSRNPRNAERLADEHGCHTAGSVEEAVKDADVIVTATIARQPILKGEWLKPGAHVNAVGAPRPEWRELDDLVMQGDVYADFRPAAETEAGDVVGSGARIVAEIGEVAGGRFAARRDRTTVFKSLGQAVEDLAAAEVVLAQMGLWKHND